MVTLYLARHGETEENVTGVLQGHMPGHLTPLGIEQARQLAVSLPSGPRFHALLSSDLERAMRTAGFLSARTGLPVTPCPLLRERDWGSLTGCPVAEARGMAVFPPDVETVEAMFARAERFLHLLRRQYDGSCVLAVGHGLFCRCVQAVLEGCAIRDIRRWQNAEVRCFRIGHPPRRTADRAESGVSAD